jgi:beta-glucanase (GH16 family)
MKSKSWMDSKRLFYAITAGALALAMVSVGAQQPLPLSDPSPHWSLRQDYSDEFSGDEVDARKWDSDVVDWGTWSWEPSNVQVRGGHLLLTARYQEHIRKGQSLFYTSGIVKTKAPPILYGYFEARMRAAPRYPGVAPAFWAYRANEKEWTEIDFVELTQDREGPGLIDTNTHVFRQPGRAADPIRERRTWTAPWDPRDDFHVYACEWNDKEIRWFVDGKLVASRPNQYWHQALDVVISMGMRSPLLRYPSADGFPTAVRIDYVRVWQRTDRNAPGR